MQRKRLWSGLARHAAALAVAFVFLVPLAWILAASLRTPGLPPPRTIEWLPNPPAWSNYLEIFKIVPLGRYALNSLVVASLAVVITGITASWAGLAMALAGPRWQARLVVVCVALLLVPTGALWLPRFVLFTWLGLIDSYGALLAPALMGSSPLFVLLFYWTYRRLPAELFESAEIDGAGLLTVWWRLALPLSRATIVAVGILTFLMYWSDFINPLLFLKTPDLYTLPIGLQQLKQMDRINWPLLLAGAVVMTAPTVALFLVVQRFFLGENKLHL